MNDVVQREGKPFQGKSSKQRLSQTFSSQTGSLASQSEGYFTEVRQGVGTFFVDNPPRMDAQLIENMVKSIIALNDVQVQSVEDHNRYHFIYG